MGHIQENKVIPQNGSIHHLKILSPAKDKISEKATAPHSSTLAWKIPWRGEPGRLQSIGSRTVGQDWATSFTFHFHALEKEMATHSSVLAWRIPGTGKPGGLPSMGSHRVRHDWSELAAKTKYIGEVDWSKLQEVFRKSMVNKDMLLLCKFKLLPSLFIAVKRFSHPSLLQTGNFPDKCKFLLQKKCKFLFRLIFRTSISYVS